MDTPYVGQQVRVYEGNEPRFVNATAIGVPVGTITAVQNERTVTILVDLHGNGQPLTLVGVSRRQETGNGWEPIEDT